MGANINITTSGNTVTVHSPYNPDFPKRARNIGGRFDGGAWVFDARDEQKVRELCWDIYGTDGTPGPTVTVRYRLNGGTGTDMWLFGRRIAHRKSRDSRVQLGDGVILLDGGFAGSGGSVQNPRLEPKEGTIVEIRDIPVAHPDLQLADHDRLAVIHDEQNDRQALLAERERLSARLAEIAEKLAE